MKTVFILLFSRSGMCVQFRTAFGVLPYHIPVVGIHSDRTMFYTWVGNRNNIVCPLYSWRQNKPQKVPTEKEKTARGSGTDLFPSAYLYHTTSQNFSLLSHVACSRPQIWRQKTRILESILARVTREPTRPPQSITQTLTGP